MPAISRAMAVVLQWMSHRSNHIVEINSSICHCDASDDKYSTSHWNERSSSVQISSHLTIHQYEMNISTIRMWRNDWKSRAQVNWRKSVLSVLRLALANGVQRNLIRIPCPSCKILTMGRDQLSFLGLNLRHSHSKCRNRFETVTKKSSSIGDEALPAKRKRLVIREKDLNGIRPRPLKVNFTYRLLTRDDLLFEREKTSVALNIQWWKKDKGDFSKFKLTSRRSMRERDQGWSTLGDNHRAEWHVWSSDQFYRRWNNHPYVVLSVWLRLVA